MATGHADPPGCGAVPSVAQELRGVCRRRLEASSVAEAMQKLMEEKEKSWEENYSSKL